MKTKQQREEALAKSLTAETTGLIPFLPYLLQDFWTLGSNPSYICKLFKQYQITDPNLHILDLACGKGAVSIEIAKAFGVSVKGIDLLEAFIIEAREKAMQHGVNQLCTFKIGDVNQAVLEESGYQCVIFGAAGNILGTPRQTLEKLKKTVLPGGFIIIDESYLPETESNTIKYQNYAYLSFRDWQQIFQDTGVTLVEEVLENMKPDDIEKEMLQITQRAKELAAQHPDKKELFDGYVNSQTNEYDDLTDTLLNATWLLQVKEK